MRMSSSFKTPSDERGSIMPLVVAFLLALLLVGVGFIDIGGILGARAEGRGRSMVAAADTTSDILQVKTASNTPSQIARIVGRSLMRNGWTGDFDITVVELPATDATADDGTSISSKTGGRQNGMLDRIIGVELTYKQAWNPLIPLDYGDFDQFSKAGELTIRHAWGLHPYATVPPIWRPSPDPNKTTNGTYRCHVDASGTVSIYKLTGEEFDYSDASAELQHAIDDEINLMGSNS